MNTFDKNIQYHIPTNLGKVPTKYKVLTILEYVFTVIIKLIPRVLGYVWWFVAFPLRYKARNVVYNYMFENNKTFPRLPSARKVRDKWWFENNIGFINYKKVSFIEFHFWRLFFWSWIDDDASLVGTAEFYAKDVCGYWDNQKAFDDVLLDDGVYTNIGMEFVHKGSYFVIGELQKENKITNVFRFLWASWLWNVRNTAYNFRYYSDGDKISNYDIREVYMGSDVIRDTMTINETNECADLSISRMGVEGSWLYNSVDNKCMFSYSKAIWVSWLNRYMELRLGWKISSKDIKHTCRFYKKCS